MEKTKLNVPVTVLAAATCFLGLYAGYLLTGILVGYVLLKEENAWLKKFCVRIMVLMLTFSVASTALNLIPNLVELLNSLLQIFNDYINMDVIYRIFNFFSNILSLLKTVLFFILGIGALLKKEFKIPVVDSLVGKFAN